MNQAIQNMLLTNEPSVRPASFLSGGGAAGGGVDAAGAADFREELASLTRRDAGAARGQESAGVGAAERADSGAVTGREQDVTTSEPEQAVAADQQTEKGTASDVSKEVSDDAPVEPEADGVVGQTGQTGQGEPKPVEATADAPVVDEIAAVAATAQPDVTAAGDDAKQAAAAGLVSVREGEAKEPAEKRGPRVDQVKGKAAAAAKVAAESAAPAVSTTTQPTAGAAVHGEAAQADADLAANPPLALQPTAKGSAESAAPAPATPSAASPVTTTAPTTAQALNVTGPIATAVSAPADQAAAREADNASLNNARLTRGLASAVNQRGGAVTLRLTPPDMGTVRIQMQLTGSVLSASMHTETASAHQMLTQQLGQLRASLETQGLTVERLHVQTMQQAQPGNASEQNGDSEQQQQHNEGRSRGRQQGGNGNAREDVFGRDGRAETDAPKTFNEQLVSNTTDTSSAQQAA